MNEEWAQIWMAKHNSRIGGVRKNMLRRKHLTDDYCPCCGETEDTDHIFRCTNNTIQEIYEDRMGEMKTWLEDNTTHEIAKGIQAVSDAFRNNTTLNVSQCKDRMDRAAAQQQFELGRLAFMGGWWSTRWLTLQKFYYNETGKRNKPIIWMARVVKKFQEMLREMWFERNNQLHNKEQSEHNRQRTMELNKKVKNIF